MDNTRPLTLTRRQILQLQQTGEVVIERKVTPQPPDGYTFAGDNSISFVWWGPPPFPYCASRRRSPFGAPGQRFWVREDWDEINRGEDLPLIAYYANCKNKPGYMPARTMPREYSRFELDLITITVINRDGWRWVGKFAKVTP